MPEARPGIALCFPGQGSQRAGMAESLLSEPLAQQLLEVAAEGGVDLASKLGADDESLRPTDIAQPALFLVEVVLGTKVRETLPIDAVAGHSVGEYAAATIAGALDAADGMRLVVERGKLMAAMTEGTMSAVIGLGIEIVGRICAEVERAGIGRVVVANDNAPGQVVISGEPRAVEAAELKAKAGGARRTVALPVSGAFHSPLMAPAAETFATLLATAHWSEPSLPVVTNVDARATTTAPELRARMTDQLRSAVHWRESLQTLYDLGVRSFVEVGPGNVLTGLTKRALPEVSAITVNNLGDASSVAEAVAVNV